jgi:ParB-like chromosome segregation protein Spo0J
MTEILDKIKEAKDLPVAEKVELYNQVTLALKDMLGWDHPVLAVQLVPLDKVVANDYNPNKVAPPEMRLLKLSITKDGLTMPSVAAQGDDGNYTIVDGFHRTTTVKGSKSISESMGGYMPVSLLNKNLEDRITSTVRHNMARGAHQTELSSRLITMLKDHNWSDARIGKELGMEADELLRLKQVSGLADLFKDKEFSKSWESEN